MAHLQVEDGGWPLGLRPLNARVGLGLGLVRNGSISFNTLITPSVTNTSSIDSSSSSDLVTQSTGSFFHDKSITLGTLLGVSSILELSKRSTRARSSETLRDKRNCYKPKTWLFSLCSKLSTDAVTMTNTNTPSLAQFLEAERRTANIYRRNQSPNLHGPDHFSRVLPISDPNPLILSGHVAPPQDPSSWSDMEHGNGYGKPLLLSCLCGHLTH